MENRIEFNKGTYLSLKREYDKAVEEGLDRFSLDGHVLLTSYAKYLIEYLSSHFGNVENKKK